MEVEGLDWSEIYLRIGKSKKDKRSTIIQKYKIEKRRNSPPNDTIYFQTDEGDGLYNPKFIYVAFSEDKKTEYKAGTQQDLVAFIIRSFSDIRFLQNNP
jgi:hypothetical protein